MKFKLLIILLSTSAIVFGQKKKVTIPITFTQQYCGGARPTPEIAAEAEKARPYSDKTIVILSSKGKLDSVKTDKNGILHLKLRKGSYKLYEAWRYNLFTPDNLPIESFDRQCIKAEWEKENYTLSVERKKNVVQTKNEIIRYCPWSIPCLLQSETPPTRE